MIPIFAIGQNIEEDTYWIYERIDKIMFSFEHIEIKLDKIVNNKVVEKNKFKSSSLDTLYLTSYEYFNINDENISGLLYSGSPMYGLNNLSKITFMSGFHDFDSTYYFHQDGISIRNISRNGIQNKNNFEIGEKYIYDYPFCPPDTLQEFYLKLLEGCPLKPCITIEQE